MKPARLRNAAWLLAALCLPCAQAAAANLDFTVATSEPVVVTGVPRIAIDVGGLTRYATYASGSGTAALTFSYAVQAGDFDPNGIAIAAPLDLNGGSITDVAGNPASGLTFTLPDTSVLKVQTYTAAFTTSPITETNASAVSFAIAKAPTGASFTYSITSSGGSGSVTGSGTISSSAHTVSGIDVSNFPAGTLTLSVTVSTSAGGTGTARTATATPTFTGALDSLPAAAVMYSLRRLRGAYTGPLLRVRRASDDTERDIAATLGGNLDAITLTNFCGSASCFVTTWYDQSGNDRNAVQNTAAIQPRVVNAGTVELEGTKPALRFMGDQLLQAPLLSGQSLQGSFNAVARVTDVTMHRHVMGDRGIITATGRVMRAVSGGASYRGFNTGGGEVSLSGATTQQRIITIWSGSAGFAGALDGTVTSGTVNSFYGAPNSGFQIGGGGVGQGAGDWIGTISEAAVFEFAIGTSDRQALERSQGSYFGISVP